MTLPTERVPFPVAPTFRIRPDMRRWPAEDRGHLRLDARYPDYLAEKLRLLAVDASGCRVLSPDADREDLGRALRRVAEAFAAESSGEASGEGGTAGGDPEAPRQAPVAVDTRGIRFPLLGLELDPQTLALRAPCPASGEGSDGAGGSVPHGRGGAARSVVPPALRARARTHLQGLPPLERLADALALAVQEDLVIMRGDGGDDAERGAAPAAAAGPRAPAGPQPYAGPPPRVGPPPPAGHAELLHVCFPSAWDPAARAGADFAALHAPVPHGEVLERAAPKVVRAMVSKGPFVRYVWSVTPDGLLDRNPRRRPDLRAQVPPEALWFRVERQTVMPMPELGRALFTIRVYASPLPRVLTSRQRRRTLAAAVASMDEALLAYKGIGTARDALLAWLQEGGATGW